jgi:hypothetical protein
MNNVLFGHGAKILGGVRVMHPEALIGSVMQGVKKHRKLAGLQSITKWSAELECMSARQAGTGVNS